MAIEDISGGLRFLLKMMFKKTEQLDKLITESDTTSKKAERSELIVKTYTIS